ncbi:hypothetical protein CHX26_00335 [Porphyrobacter sp. HT-58-2]|uniref:DUF1254 domain-containing protein n=1 Tax=Porphyrobacter sp. HT-58-2 TaxID=2023229 RepID=UPI000CDCBC9A|nr:DUF1254 domain-containing protein [Porphyrobacter sp. HT-58-2]AUX68168.1 hypothetical protein CHX26_00335 [Porphyrobacter sp. HT-58-2]
MKRWIGPLAVLMACAVAGHALTLYFAPSFIMARAMDALAARGVALHAFTTPERVTPQSQQVVRSSPDLYYALCRYDLTTPEGGGSGAPRLEVTMARWDDYQSLSFFDASTNNFATIRGTGKSVSVGLQPGVGENGPVTAFRTGDPGRFGRDFVVYSPTTKGVILIRRLAPSAEAFAKALEVGKLDDCRFELAPMVVY